MLSTQFKNSFAVGAVANGIKTDAFTFFLLFFYSRVIGLDPLLASLAIATALIIDSVTDPLMGAISDRTSSAYGRRHPYMFVAFLPVSIFYILLFSPSPEWGLSQTQLFWWMLVCASLTRIGMTLFEVPHRSFGAEIAQDYYERTELFSRRELFQWTAAITNAFLAYYVFFKSTPSYPFGQLNPEAWFPLAVTGGFFMALSMLYSSWTTRSYISELSEWEGRSSLKEMIKEIYIALSNKSFVIFFVGNLTISIAWGLLNTLTLFINTDFWQLSGSQITVFLFVYILAPFVSFKLVPPLVKLMDKRNLVLVCLFGVALSSPAAFIFYNLGLTPEKGTYTLVYFLCIPLIFISTLSIMGNMVRDSMIGDIADEVQLQSGKRQEGVLYSSVSFIQKVNTALGSITSGIVLSYLSYPKDDPSYEQTYSLFFVQGVVGPVLLFIPMFIFYFYSLTKTKHNKIIEALRG